MTAQDVRDGADAGFEVGSHGKHHVPLTALSASLLTEEIEGSRRILQEVSEQAVTGFCYPYGEFDSRVVRAVQAAGYEYACAIGQSEFTGLCALPRIDISDDDSSLRLWMKSALYWLR
jgi:peptidoglycan/xylan/chitin deacetylase (PgdA/CDA1 family)